MSTEQLVAYVQAGGAYCAPLLLMALFWMNKERRDLLTKLEAKSLKVESMAERMIVLMTELRMLMDGGKKRGI